MTQLQINDLFKSAFGFERMFNNLERHSKSVSNFPPYNIIIDRFNHPNTYLLEMAVAGFSRDDISVKILQDNDIRSLVITGEKAPKESGENAPEYVVRMMANRSFKRVFNLADNAVVDSVELKDGMLLVTVVDVIPETRNSETVLTIK